MALLLALLAVLSLGWGCAGPVELRGRSAAGSLAVAPARPDSNLPAFIVLDGRSFGKLGGDGALDAGETGLLTVALRNDGPGPGTVGLRLTPLDDAAGLDFARQVAVVELAPGQVDTVQVEIVAGWETQTAQREILVEALEHRSRALESFALRFETRAAEPPVFRLIVRDFSDERQIYPGNAPDGLVQAGEMVRVVANLQNTGGAAEGVNVRVASLGDVRFLRDLAGEGGDGAFALGDLGRGENRDIEFYFFTSPVFADSAAVFRFAVEEAHGRFGVEDSLSLPIGQRVRTQGLLAVEAAPRQVDDIVAVTGGGVDVDRVPTGSRSRREQGLAVVFGIEDYRYTFDAAYKHRDAVTFYRYCRDVLGIPTARIQLRTDAEATKAEFDYIFEPKGTANDGWLKKRLTDSQAAAETDLFVYLAGHGFPDLANGRPYLIPHDVRPEQTTNGIDLEELYRTLAGYGARSVTVFVEACFTGASGYESGGGERLLALNMNPVFPVIERPAVAGDLVVFSATSGKKPSNNRDDLRHGIFTYYLLKGLGGEADVDRDDGVTVAELFGYVRRQVPAKALEPPLDREQVPQILPGLEALGERGRRVLVQY